MTRLQTGYYIGKKLSVKKSKHRSWEKVYSNDELLYTHNEEKKSTIKLEM